MNMNMKQAWTGIRRGLDTAFEKGLEGAAQVAAVVADEAPGLFSQSKTLRDYRLEKPVATCGPGDLWAIYAGTCKKPGAVQKSVSIWILDKKRILETSKQTAKGKAFDLVFEQQKRSCLHMTRLKHPGVVKVIEPLEDSPQQMVLVTEAIFGSVRNVMTHFSAVPGAAADVKAVSMSPLELKMGLVRVIETLSFLHAEAGLAHCGLQSAVIMVTAGGTWKLAGFCFAPAVAGAPGGHYVYSDPYPPMYEELAKPSLQYAAPEQVESHQGGPQMGAGRDVTPAADVFSLATVMYELVGPTGQPLLPQTHNLHEYRSKITALGTSHGSADELATLPTQLQGMLRSMLALSPGSRPSVSAVSSCSYFQDDVLLRALRFLDGILQRDHAQKVAFVTDLSHFWSQYDDRVLQLLVLPPLIQELRDPLLQPSLVPLVLAMLERATPAHFMSALLPALQPVLEGAQGELLAALVSASGVLASLMTAEAAGKYLVPLYTRALDSEGQPQVQEKCLRMLQGSMSRLDYLLLRAHIMPRVHAVCMRTTAAVVRVNALGLMTCAVPRLDKEEAGTMIDTATQVVSVDRSAATLINVAQLAAAISTQHGAEVTATRLLPLVCPLLLASSLAPKQFKEVFDVAQGMLDRLQARVLGPGGQAALAASTVSTASTTSPTTWDTPLELPSSATKHRPTALPPAGAGPGTAGEGLWQASAGSTWTSHASTPPSTSWMGPSATASTLHPPAANPVAGGGWVSSGATDLSLLKNTGSLGLGSTGTGGGTSGSGIGTSGRPANGSASQAAWGGVSSAIAHSTGGTAALNGGGAWGGVGGAIAPSIGGTAALNGGAAWGAAGGSNGHATGIKAAASSGLGDDDMFGGLAVYEGNQAAAPTANLQGSGFSAPAATRTPSTGMHAGPFSNQSQMPSSTGGMGMGSHAPAWGGASPMGMGMSSHKEGGGLAGFGALAAAPSITSKASIGGGSISHSTMPGRPMGMLSSATSSSAPPDPFSSLNSIALSAPVQPHPPQASRGSNVSSSTVSPAKPLPALAPPPRASTTVQATTTQAVPAPQAAPPSSNTLDLLW